tara:strand:- start:147 stop:725 length:579 start_codon:yes stop_codon:yes gene_type:complete
MFNLSKYFFDFFFSSFLLLLLSPLFTLLFLIIFINFRSNPIFYQKRSSIYGKSFTIYKFKTMFDNSLIKPELRINFIGKYIRKFKLDELPQLFNVIKGDMSIVGPRPLFMEYNDKYSDADKIRLTVKPGITGLAQIMIMNSSNWSHKMKLDRYYVKHQSFCFDLIIIIKTIKLLLDILFNNTKIIESHFLKK